MRKKPEDLKVGDREEISMEGQTLVIEIAEIKQIDGIIQVRSVVVSSGS